MDKKKNSSIQMNRSGQLSDEQVRRLKQFVQKKYMPSVSLWLTLFIIGVMFFFITNTGFFFFGFNPEPILLIVAAVIVGLFLVNVGYWLYQRSKVDAYVNEDVWLERTQGMIVFRKNKYVAEIDGKYYTPIDQNLHPAHYEFFILPNTPYCFVGDCYDSDAMIDEAIYETLNQVNNFKSEDLEINQQGRMSSRQRNELIEKVAFTLLVPAAVVIVFIAFFQFMGRGFSYSGFPNGILIAFLGFFILIFALSQYKYVRDIFSGEVVSDEGYVTKRKRIEHHRSGNSHSSSKTIYEYVLNGNAFKVKKKAFDAFIEDYYQVYYSPQSKTLMQIVPLDTENPQKGKNKPEPFKRKISPLDDLSNDFDSPIEEL